MKLNKIVTNFIIYTTINADNDKIAQQKAFKKLNLATYLMNKK